MLMTLRSLDLHQLLTSTPPTNVYSSVSSLLNAGAHHVDYSYLNIQLKTGALNYLQIQKMTDQKFSVAGKCQDLENDGPRARCTIT